MASNCSNYQWDWCGALGVLFLGMSVPRLHALVALYPTAVSGHDPVDDTDQFLADLDLVEFRF